MLFEYQSMIFMTVLDDRAILLIEKYEQVDEWLDEEKKWCQVGLLLTQSKHFSM